MAENFFEELVRRLTSHGVEFVVVGGLSAVLHGAPIVTQDIDLCYRRSRENVKRLVAALAPLQPRLRDFPPDLPFVFDERTIMLGSNFTFQIGPEMVDLLCEMDGIGGFEQAAVDAESLQVGVVIVRVLSLEKLIRTKQAAGRPKDYMMIPHLEATLRKKQGN